MQAMRYYIDLIGSHSPLLLELVGRFELEGLSLMFGHRSRLLQGSFDLDDEFKLRITVLLAVTYIGRQ